MAGWKNKGRALAKMERLPVAVHRAVRAQLAENAADLVETIKRRAPKEDGNLQASVRKEERLRADKLTQKVMAGGKLTRKPVRKSEKGNAPEYDYAAAQEWGTAEMPAQPFFFPSYRQNKKKYKRRLKAAARKAIRAEIGK